MPVSAPPDLGCARTTGGDQAVSIGRESCDQWGSGASGEPPQVDMVEVSFHWQRLTA